MDQFHNPGPPSGTNDRVEVHPMPFGHPQILQHPPYQISSARSYTDLQYLFGIQDLAMAPTKQGRVRRKSTQGSDAVKHRRTRSGCYTCRSRRVKCDETRPICDRCRKGARDCVYPGPSKSTKLEPGDSKAAAAASRESPSSSDHSDDEEEPDATGSMTETGEQLAGKLPNSTYESEHQDQNIKHQKSFTTQSSDTPSLILDKGISPSPSTEGSISHNAFSTATRLPSQGPSKMPVPKTAEKLLSDWSHLPQDLQFFLAYFCQNLTFHHYSIKYDNCEFLRTHFLDAALRNDALLHAVVGFSAFQYTLSHKGGEINHFLQYYNKAVSLLLRSLKRGERHTLGVLFAILQLATIEEYLGDWINLMGHQKAAYEILTQLYNPQTIMETDCSRVTLGWYSRFDIFAGLMGGFETVLSRDWFSGSREYFARKVIDEPEVIDWKIEEAIADIRLIAMDMSILFARKGKGEMIHDDFLAENDSISQRITDWNQNMDPALRNPIYRVTDFTGARPLDADDIVNPYIPGTLYAGPLWAINKCMIDWYSVDLMHKYQTALTLQTQPSKELAMKAYASCELFEAIEYWPHSPPGSLLSCQASLGIASLFLPRDHAHAMWCRRKLAVIETQGYIYPLTFRTKMAALFQDQSCMHWWLPNDDSYPPIIRSIRRFVEERTSEARDLPAEDLRDMKAIFSSMKLDDGGPKITK